MILPQLGVIGFFIGAKAQTDIVKETRMNKEYMYGSFDSFCEDGDIERLDI